MSQTWISKSTRREQLKGNRSDQHQYIIKRNSLGPAFAVGKKTKSGLKWEKYRRAKRAQRRPGGGEGTTEPGDMSLMPPFHDTRFWYHALIGQMSSCWQIRALSKSRSYYSGNNTNFSAPRREKNVSVIG